MTWRAVTARAIARHVVDTGFEPSVHDLVATLNPKPQTLNPNVASSIWPVPPVHRQRLVEGHG